MENLKEKYSDIIDALEEELSTYEYFMKNVRNFETTKVKKHVHSVRSRLKDTEHLIEKNS